MTSVRSPDAFREAVLEAEGAVLALFYAEWCPFCRRYLPVFREAEAPGVDRVEVDISDEASPLWEAYDVAVVPTLVLFRDGAAVDRADGRLMWGLRREDLDRLLGRVSPREA